MRIRRKKIKLSSIIKEVYTLNKIFIEFGLIHIPMNISKIFYSQSALINSIHNTRLSESIGSLSMKFFDKVGPFYGKLGQMALSNLSEKSHKKAETFKLTRLYSNWDEMPFESVSYILDREIPDWRSEFKIKPKAIGVASIAQVHELTDKNNKKWVIKILKPQAKKRLLESLDSLESIIMLLKPFVISQSIHRLMGDLQILCNGLRDEISFIKEQEIIKNANEKLTNVKNTILVIPKVNSTFSTDSVLVLEMFEGESIADIVSKKTILPKKIRKKLARKVLNDLLVQVFEIGYFHADPHAGNLILLDNYKIGIFDWGLIGEIGDKTRLHISQILKAVINMDIDKLAQALLLMAKSDRIYTNTLTKDEIKHELEKASKVFKKNEFNEVSLSKMFNSSLKVADKLNIFVPNGLLMMVKCLITVEGLAKGIDPDVSFKMIASPILWKASKPTFKDWMKLSQNITKINRIIRK